MSIGDAVGEDPVGGYSIIEYNLLAIQGTYAYTGQIANLFTLIFGATPGTIIISTAEDSFTSTSLSITTANPPVTWGWSLSPPDINNNFLISQSGNNLNVAYVSYTNLWTPNITYLDSSNNLKTVSNWSSLPTPASSPEIVSMLPDDNNTMLWTLTATATDNIGNAATTTYTIKVEANYSINKELLTSQLAERF